MDRLQHQDLQTRQSSPFATQFDMSEQVSLPFGMASNSTPPASLRLRNSLHWAAASLMTPPWLLAREFSILTLSSSPLHRAVQLPRLPQ